MASAVGAGLSARLNPVEISEFTSEWCAKVLVAVRYGFIGHQADALGVAIQDFFRWLRLERDLQTKLTAKEKAD